MMIENRRICVILINFKTLFAKKTKKTDLIEENQTISTRRVPLETLKAKRLAEVAIEECKELIDNLGPRITGSSSCLETASSLEEKLRNYCDFTSKQKFSHKGKAFAFWIKLLPYVYLVGLILLLFGLPITATLVYFLFGYYVYREFIKYKPLGEKYFKSTPGCNVHGVIEPLDEVKQTIIFTSHHDSAPIPSYSKGNIKEHFIKVTLPLILFGASAFCLVVQLIVELVSHRFFAIGFPPISSIVFIILLMMSSVFVFPIQKYFSEKGSVGAGDNLISCTTLVQIARYFRWKKENNKPLKNTRLIFCSFDAEEVGLRGSRVWFDKHQALLVNAMQINFDCLYSSKNLVFIENDINGTQKLSRALAERGVKLATSMGYNAKMDELPFLSGGTDAAEGFRLGLEAITIMAIDFNHLGDSFFHTERDTVDNIEVKAIEQAISIAIKLASITDSDGFEDEEPVIQNEEVKEEMPFLSFNKLTRK